MATRGARNFRNKEKLSFKKSFAAWAYLVPFFKMVWKTSPSLTLANIISRLVKAALPLAMLYVGKLIIDEVILQVAAEVKDYSLIWKYLIIEFILALVSDSLNRLITLFDALLGDLFSNKSSEQLIEKAASLDLAQFEDPGFYDKLERARRQTTGRVVLMSQAFSQVQDIITVFFLAIGLVVFEPWLILLLIIAILPSFLNESYFSQTGYSLVRSWTPQRRELDYLRYIGANDETAKEIKIFGLSDFIKTRFADLADKYYHANKKLAIKKTIWGSAFHVIGDAAYYGAYVLIVFRTVAGILTVGDLTFLAGSFNRMRNQLQTIFSRFSKITESALYLKDYFEFLKIEPTIIELDDAKAMKEGIKEGFTFENVGFKYPGTDKWAVRNIDFFLNHPSKITSQIV
jgi:ATP-binding cassette subfamily B protein